MKTIIQHEPGKDELQLKAKQKKKKINIDNALRRRKTHENASNLKCNLQTKIAI